MITTQEDAQQQQKPADLEIRGIWVISGSTVQAGSTSQVPQKADGFAAPPKTSAQCHARM